MSLTARQQEIRARGIGSSEIGAVAGLNPFSAPIDVWLEKTGRAEDAPEKPAQGAGKLFEPVIAEWWQKQTGAKSLEAETTHTHPDEPWIIATPDYRGERDGGERLVEVKRVGFRMLHHWTDGAPDYVLAQVYWQLHAHPLELTLADIVADLGGSDLPRIETVEYDPGIVRDLVEIGREFWFEHVLKDVPPPVDASQSWRDYLSRRWPRDLRPMESASEEADEWAALLHRARRTRDEAQQDVALAEQNLKELIGERAGLFRRGQWRVTWKRDRAGRPDWKAIAEALGATEELIQRHRTEPARRFLFKWGE